MLNKGLGPFDSWVASVSFIFANYVFCGQTIEQRLECLSLAVISEAISAVLMGIGASLTNFASMTCLASDIKTASYR
jgi:uncharacterized membrane protein